MLLVIHKMTVSCVGKENISSNTNVIYDIRTCLAFNPVFGAVLSHFMDP